MSLFTKILLITVILSIFCSITFSCSSRHEVTESQETSQSTDFKNLFFLKPIYDKTFIIDTLTTSEKIWVSYYHGNNNKRKLYLLSYLDHSLQSYDWDKGTLLYKRKLVQEGPNGVGRPFSMIAASEDSIYVLSPYDYKVTLINSLGRALKQYPLFAGTTETPTLGSGVLALSNSSSQIAIIDNKLIVGGSPNDDCKKKSFYTKGQTGISLDLATGRVDYLMNIPSVFSDRYENGFALSGQQTFFGQTHNLERKTAIINFPTENDLYEININTKQINRHYAGSEQFKAIEYGNKALLDIHKEYEYWAKQPEFPSIYYDPYHKMYIRFIATPNLAKSNIYDSSDGKSLFKLAVIILVQNFKKVGEQKLSDDYWEAKAFVTPEGIFLMKHTGDETKLVYTLYSIAKTNETPD